MCVCVCVCVCVCEERVERERETETESGKGKRAAEDYTSPHINGENLRAISTVKNNNNTNEGSF